jgi:hypothetical protein
MATAAAANEAWFPGGRPTQDVLLKARGFGAGGHRSGGIKFDHISNAIVTVPAGAILLRLFNKPADFGEWWFTPAEYRRIQAYFAVSGDLLADARATGGSVFHGTLALLSGWYAHSPDQIGRFHVIEVTQPVIAMYGEGDVATETNWSRTLKPVVLGQVGGWARGARQIFLPEAWKYQKAFTALMPPGDTDTLLDRCVAGLPTTTLPFEG